MRVAAHVREWYFSEFAIYFATVVPYYSPIYMPVSVSNFNVMENSYFLLADKFCMSF